MEDHLIPDRRGPCRSKVNRIAYSTPGLNLRPTNHRHTKGFLVLEANPIGLKKTQRSNSTMQATCFRKEGKSSMVPGTWGGTLKDQQLL